MYCCPPTGRKGRGGKMPKKYSWRTVTNPVFLIGKCYPSGLVWDCVGGTTTNVPKWVSNSWFGDSSITGMSHFFEPVCVCERMVVTEMILGPKRLACFFMGPSTCTSHWFQAPAALIKCFNPKWKLNCWLLTPNVSLNFQSVHRKEKTNTEQIIPLSSV